MRSLTPYRRTIATLALATFTFVTAAACASTPRERKGAVIGAGTGAVAGGLIGKAVDSTAIDSRIGAAVAGAAAAVIGRSMTQQAAEIEHAIPGVIVERFGEGILVNSDSGILFDFDSATVTPDVRENRLKVSES